MTPAECADYWSKAQAFEWYDEHPAQLHDSSHLIPVRLYGDDANYSGRGGRARNGLVLTFSALLCSLPSILSRLLITVLPLGCAIDATYRELYLIISHNINCLLDGAHPHTDHRGKPWPDGSWRQAIAGQPIAGPWRCALAQVLGDWKFLKEAFLLQQSYTKRMVCHLCFAVKHGDDGPPFDDFGKDAQCFFTTFAQKHQQ